MNDRATTDRAIDDRAIDDRAVNDRATSGHRTAMPSSLRTAALLTALTALTAAPAFADPPATLHVQIDGAPPGPIAAAIATELGLAIELAERGACPAPCVSIAIGADRVAAVAVALPEGAHARTIALPADPAAAAEIVALVVGNLARDEAAGLLASLAPPAPTSAVEPPAATDGESAAPAAAATQTTAPAPAPAPSTTPASPATPASAARPPATAFAVGLIPPLSYEASGARPGVAIDVVVGVRRRLYAFSVSAVGSIVREDVRGTQIGGAFTLAEQVRGTQIAGALAVGARVEGTQLAGAAALAGPLRGTQLAGAVAVASRVDGTQVAGAVAHSHGDARGAQLAGAAAIAGGTVDVQVAGAVAYARRVRGVQVSGAVNVANRVDGVQVGVVNVSGGGDGASIGLINLVAGGRTDVEGTVDSDQLGAVILRHGSRRWHNAYGVAGRAAAGTVDRELGDDEPVALGLGMGPSWRRGATGLDLELMAWHVTYGGHLTDHLSTLGQLRATVSHRIGPLSLVAGAALNAYVTDDPARDRLDRARMATVDDGVRVMVWPTGFVGLRL